MALFDQYGGVKKHGYQIYKKDCILVDKDFYEEISDKICDYFSDEKDELNLVYYLGDKGVTASYTDLYCSKETFKKYIEPILKKEW